MKRRLELFILTKREQRVVIILLMLLLAAAVAKYYREVHSHSFPPALPIEQTPTSPSPAEEYRASADEEVP